MHKATQQQTKTHNRNLVLKTIFEHESISRAQIARLTSLTRTTVSEIVADLIAASLVSEIGMGAVPRGKSPILLSLAKDSRHLIGLDLAQDQFSGAIINLRGEICQRVDIPIQNSSGQAALNTVYAILDELVQSAGAPLVGIGVGAPGLVDARQGRVIHAVNLDWRDLPLAGLLEARYHLPASVLNDSQAAALGEYIFGENQPPEQNLIVINARHGIGAGIILQGHLFHGDGGGAGEIGHVVLVPEGGLPCRCGNFGCLETVASAQAVVQRLRTLAGGNPSEAANLDRVVQAFSAGDPQARQVVLEAGRTLGLAISHLIGALNIHKIILTGDMTRFGQPWLEAIQKTISHTAFTLLAQETRVELGQLDSNGILLGASALILKDYSLLFKPS